MNDHAARTGTQSRPIDERVQDRINRQIYHAKNIEQHYRSGDLMPAEAIALLKYQPSLFDRDVLDIGVGTGRTTRYLTPLARHYEGIDYSPYMVAYMQRSMPDRAVHQADMRDLSRFPAESFDLVFAGDNVIDAVSHTDRLTVLTEVRRVLRPGGRFMFSSHNRANPRSLDGPRLDRSRNPVTQLAHMVRYLRKRRNHSHVAPFRCILPDYSLLNDQGHDYALLHYYIERDIQQQQLEQQCFALLDVFDDQGSAVDYGQRASSSASLLYVAERIGAARNQAHLRPTHHAQQD